MKARVGTLAVGTRFVTCLTGRAGHVRAADAEGVDVTLESGPVFVQWKTLHPSVIVEVVGVEREVIH